MKSKATCIMKFSLCLFCFLVLGSKELYAEEPEGKHAAPKITNIGFMESPPKELKDKFPMCDAFVNVEWIDKEKKVGYAHYELYDEGGKNKRETSALVYLHEYSPRFDYNVETEQKTGKLKEVFSWIKQGEVTPYFTGQCSCDLEVQTKVDGQTIVVVYSPREDKYPVTLADNRKTVCIPYPDYQRMWIAEGKKAGKIYSRREKAKFREKLAKSGLDSFPLEASEVIDINFDGVSDYFAGVRVVYSFGNKYYESTALSRGKRNLKSGAGTEYRGHFPTTPKECDVLPTGDLFFTTDGRNFYLNNKCNLTELTKRGE